MDPHRSSHQQTDALLSHLLSSLFIHSVCLTSQVNCKYVLPTSRLTSRLLSSPRCPASSHASGLHSLRSGHTYCVLCTFCAPLFLPLPRITGQKPRPLVRVGCTHCCASTSRLSHWSSTSGLTWLSSGGSHLEVGFPLRCFQRFSAPEIATRLCQWLDNRHTSAPFIPVLSY